MRLFAFFGARNPSQKREFRILNNVYRGTGDIFHAIQYGLSVSEQRHYSVLILSMPSRVLAACRPVVFVRVGLATLVRRLFPEPTIALGRLREPWIQLTCLTRADWHRRQHSRIFERRGHRT